MAWREKLQVGALTVEQPLIVPAYALADLPPAADWTYGIVFVTDATPPNLAVSDGTNWIAADDGAVAA